MGPGRFRQLVVAALAALAAGGPALLAEERDTKNSMTKAAADAAAAKTKPKPKPTGWCRSNECAGMIAGAKNDCSGKMACKSFKKATCEVDGMGTWQTSPPPTP